MVLSYLPLYAVLLPIIAILGVVVMERTYPEKRNHYTVIITIIVFLMILSMYPHIKAGEVLGVEINTGFRIDFSYRVDALGFILGLVSIVIWMLASIFSISYMKKEHALTRYNMHSLLSLAGMLGVVFTGNLFSLYLVFELLCVASYVLVIQEENPEAMRAGLIYLFMGVFGGLILLLAIVGTYAITGTTDLSLIGIGLKGHPLLPYIFWGYIIGFGVKAGLFPLHVWLPKAHPVAPSPASALLSGVMIKAGAYGIIRTIYSIVGKDIFLQKQSMTMVTLFLALIAVFVGSALAISQKDLKKILAYSSISQMGYIIMGVALLSPLGLIGGVVHIFNHAIIKSTLFLSAGAFIYLGGIRTVDDLVGVGKQMPIVTGCFTLAALSMIGFPPFNGFISKWFLGLGALESIKIGSYAAPVGIIALSILLLSSFMNLIYYGPIVYRAWFVPNSEHNNKKQENAKAIERSDLFVTIPLVILALGTLFFGIFPQFPINLARQVSQLYFP